MDAKDTLTEEIQAQVEGAIEVFKEASRLSEKGDDYIKLQSYDNAKRAWHHALEKIDEVMTIMQKAVSRGYPSEVASDDEVNINHLKSEIMAKLDAQNLREENQQLQQQIQQLQQQLELQSSIHNNNVDALQTIENHFRDNPNLTRSEYENLPYISSIRSVQLGSRDIGEAERQAQQQTLDQSAIQHLGEQARRTLMESGITPADM